MTNIKNQDIHSERWSKSIIKHGKWYLNASIFTKGIGILLLPVYTRYLTPGEYGILSSLMAVVQLLMLVISLYIDSAFARFFHEAKKSQEEVRRLFSTVYIFTVFYGSGVIVIAVLTSVFWMPSLLEVPVWPYAPLVSVNALFLQLGILGQVFLRQSLLSKKITILQITSAIITASVTITLLVGYDLGVIARFWGGLVSSLALLGFYTYYFINKGILKFHFESKLLFKCLAYSLPLTPTIIGSWVARSSDRFVLAKYASLEAVGIFSLASQLALILYLIQDAITQVTGPITMSGLIHDKEKTKRRISFYSLYLLGFMLIAHLGVVIFSRELIMIFADSQYYESIKIVGIVSFYYVLSSQYRVFMPIILYHKKTYLLSLASILQGVLNLTLNLILVPQYGYFASAWAAVFSVACYSWWVFLWSQHLDKIMMPWKNIFKVLLVYAGALLLTVPILLEHSSFQNYIIRFSLFTTATILMLMVMGLKDRLKSFVFSET